MATKRENFEAIVNFLQANGAEAELVEVMQNEIEHDIKRAEKAAERAAAKRAEGDEMRAIVQSHLTSELITADEITDAIDNEDISVSKVRARLTQLVNAGIAVKEQISVVVETEDGKEKTKKVMAYALA